MNLGHKRRFVCFRLVVFFVGGPKCRRLFCRLVVFFVGGLLVCGRVAASVGFVGCGGSDGAFGAGFWAGRGCPASLVGLVFCLVS